MPSSPANHRCGVLCNETTVPGANVSCAETGIEKTENRTTIATKSALIRNMKKPPYGRMVSSCQKHYPLLTARGQATIEPMTDRPLLAGSIYTIQAGGQLVKLCYPRKKGDMLMRETRVLIEPRDAAHMRLTCQACNGVTLCARQRVGSTTDLSTRWRVEA